MMPANIRYLDLLGHSWESVGRCYGLLRLLYARGGVILPEVEDPDSPEGRNELIITRLAESSDILARPEPWAIVSVSLLGSKFVTHVGAVLPGCRRFIHAIEFDNRGVTTDRITRLRWGRIRGFYRWIG